MGWQDDPVVAPAASGGGWQNDPIVGGAPTGPEVTSTNEAIPFYVKVGLAAHTGEDEKEAFLKKVYGDKAVQRVKGPWVGGREALVINKDGKQTPVGDEGFLAHAVADAPEMIGGAVGGILGTAAGPGGTVGGAAGGAVIGRQVKNVLKSFAGTQRQSAGQVATDLAEAGTEGAAGEIGGQVAGKVGSSVAKGVRKGVDALFELTPAAKTQNRRLIDEGARVSGGQLLPGAKYFQRVETIGQQIGGKSSAQENANNAYLNKRLTGIFKGLGANDDMAAAAVRDLHSNTSAFDAASPGRAVQKAAQAVQEHLEARVSAGVKAANDELDVQLSHIEARTGRYKTGGLGVDAAKGIIEARKRFSAQFSQGYELLSRTAGSRPFVPIGPLRDAAAQIVEDSGLKSAVPGMQKEAARLEDPVSSLLDKFGIPLPKEGGWTLSQAQRVRTILRERAFSADLTPGVVKHDFGVLADAMDEAFDLAARNPANKPLVDSLRQLDAGYKAGIQKFKEATVKRLVADARAGMPSDPNQVAATLMDSGSGELIKQVKAMLPAETWGKVIGADVDRMLNASVYRNESGQSLVRGETLLKQILRRGDNMELVHGPEVTRQLREFATALAARDGGTPLETIKLNGVKAALTELRAAQADLDKFMTKNLAHVLASLQPPEAAFHWIVQPGKGSQTVAAFKLLGKDSPQIVRVKKAAFEQLAQLSKISALTNENKAGSAHALAEAYSKFTETQKKLLFPGQIGRDIETLAKDLPKLFPANAETAAAGMEAGSYASKKLGFVRRAWNQAQYHVMRFVLSSPGLMRALAVGIENPRTLAMTRRIIMDGARYPAMLEQRSSQDTPDGVTGDDLVKGLIHATSPAGAVR